MWEVFSHGELPYAKLSDDETLEGQCDASEARFLFCSLSQNTLNKVFRDERGSCKLIKTNQRP